MERKQKVMEIPRTNDLQSESQQPCILGLDFNKEKLKFSTSVAGKSLELFWSTNQSSYPFYPMKMNGKLGNEM